jgi:lipopolysaccharide transport system ATP-binding protein
MSRPVIQVEGLGKAYRLGVADPTHTNFRETLTDILRTPLKRMRMKSEDWSSETDTHWALRDVNFHVNRGEVLGVIGRNGAGKSTLLKVLSRITEPTEGQARLRGRVSSLLEVGTGFHPELSGRENIYLNGAILGMPRTEIRRKFDEIVAFSEISRFLDTPVKRYSSGMYVRLAFAVAAHLEPEVLIVDEVLAVGDAAFQKKCLGKMGDVVREGRTVLFVSHNMEAIATLCTHVLLMNRGRASERLTPDEGVKQYLAQANADSDLPLRDRPRKQNRERPSIFTNLTIQTDGGHRNVVECGGRVTFEIEAEHFEDVRSSTVGIALHNERGQRIVFFHTDTNASIRFDGAARGRFTCTVPSLPLIPNSYYVELVMADERGIIEQIERVERLDVVHADVLATGKLPKRHQGYFVLPATWEADLGTDENRDGSFLVPSR